MRRQFRIRIRWGNQKIRIERMEREVVIMLWLQEMRLLIKGEKKKGRKVGKMLGREKEKRGYNTIQESWSSPRMKRWHKEKVRKRGNGGEKRRDPNQTNSHQHSPLPLHLPLRSSHFLPVCPPFIPPARHLKVSHTINWLQQHLSPLLLNAYHGTQS